MPASGFRHDLTGCGRAGSWGRDDDQDFDQRRTAQRAKHDVPGAVLHQCLVAASARAVVARELHHGLGRQALQADGAVLVVTCLGHRGSAYWQRPQLYRWHRLQLGSPCAPGKTTRFTAIPTFYGHSYLFLLCRAEIGCIPGTTRGSWTFLPDLVLELAAIPTPFPFTYPHALEKHGRALTVEDQQSHQRRVTSFPNPFHY